MLFAVFATAYLGPILAVREWCRLRNRVLDENHAGPSFGLSGQITHVRLVQAASEEDSVDFAKELWIIVHETNAIKRLGFEHRIEPRAEDLK